MLTRTRLRIAAVVGSAAMALGLIGAAPASAQPVITGGLVNVTVTDLIDANGNNVVVQVPIGVAANLQLCGVDVNAAVLAQDIRDGSQTTTCTMTSGDFTQLPRAFQRQ